ncbi:hypothetical protein D3C80_1894050 [compost metagenome]
MHGNAACKLLSLVPAGGIGIVDSEAEDGLFALHIQVNICRAVVQGEVRAQFGKGITDTSRIADQVQQITEHRDALMKAIVQPEQRFARLSGA